MEGKIWRETYWGAGIRYLTLICGFLDCLCPRVATHFEKDVGYVIPYGVDADIELLAYFEVDVPFGDQLQDSLSPSGSRGLRSHLFQRNQPTDP